MPDLALLMTLLGRKISADSAALAATDKAHEKELADDVSPREERDTGAAEVRQILVDLRGAVDVAYGLAGLTTLGLTGVTPSERSRGGVGLRRPCALFSCKRPLLALLPAR